MKARSGFILFICLIVMALISLLVLTGMQQVLVYHKALAALSLQNTRFTKLEQTGMALLENPDPHCLIKGMDPNDLITKLKHQQGCVIKDQDFTLYYTIEDLGLFPCLVIQQGERIKATQHFRMSLILEGDEKNEALLLQLRQIVTGGESDCTGVKHQTREGISSWRYLSEG